MKKIIEQAVDVLFDVVSTLTYPATYIVVKKSGFDTDRSETHALNVIVSEDETSDYMNDSTKSHDLKILFQTKKLPVTAKHGDIIKIDGSEYKIEEPVSFDPIKVTTTLVMSRIS